MNSGVSLGQLLLAFAAMIASGGAVWGALLQRVKTLEKEVAGFASFGERLTRIEEQTRQANGSLDKLVASWLFRQPPAFDEGPAVSPRRARAGARAQER